VSVCMYIHNNNAIFYFVADAKSITSIKLVHQGDHIGLILPIGLLFTLGSYIQK
jgi:hypothetical protein